MSIFSKWFKKKNEEVVTENETQVTSNKSYCFSSNVINEAVSDTEVKIPWGTPRSKMTTEQLKAIREYDRLWYANNRSKKAKEKSIAGR